MKVTVYSKPACAACNLVMKQFTKRGVTYEHEEIADHPEVFEAARAAGVKAFPIVAVEDGDDIRLWGGADLDRIKELEAAVRTT